jgi:threonine dehydrogenase-like Zn-dependent dehydrogenase
MTRQTGDRSATAFWVTDPGAGELRDEVLPPLGPGQVRIRTLYTGISRGTEALVFQGRVPPSEYQRMRAPFQDGDFPAPVKYGYCSIGEVEEGPADAIGRRVFCLYPHQTRYQVPVDQTHRLPDSVPSGRAVLAANLETAVNGLWDAAPRLGDRIAVVGAGVLGTLCAWLAGRIPGCEVELIDIDPRREAVAGRLGLAFCLPERARPDADLVIHASGAPAGLVTSLELAGFEARVVELSWYGDRQVALPLGQGFHQRRLRLISSQVGSVADAQRARWDHRRRMTLALRLLADQALDCLITGEDHFRALPAVQARLAETPAGTLMHRIRYD